MKSSVLIQSSMLSNTAWRPDCGECKSSLLTLPIDIILQILDLLKPASRTLLLLCNKALYSLFEKRDRLTLRDPRTIAWATQPRVYWQRERLLRTLEEEDSGRWLYCSKCLSLHSPDRFLTPQIRRHPRERRCIKHPQWNQT